MSYFLPKSYGPRQGTRVKDRWGPCKECGYPATFKCFRCHNWRCGTCVRFRKARGEREGVYHCACWPKCRKRMRPEIAERVKGITRFLDAQQ